MAGIARTYAAVLVLCGAVVVGGCGADDGGGSGDSACIGALLYDGRDYHWGGLQKPKQEAQIPRDRLTLAGEGIQPACNDQGQDYIEPDRKVDVYQIADYDPSVVISISRSVWVADGRRVPQSLRDADWLEWITP